MRRQGTLIVGGVVLAVVALAGVLVLRPPAVPPVSEQLCALEDEHRAGVQHGYHPETGPDVVLVPTAGASLGQRSGPVPLLFYGPGLVPAVGELDSPATLADVVPTVATFLRAFLRTEDGARLSEVVEVNADLLTRAGPRLIATLVLDDADDTLLPGELVEGGVAYADATAGWSPVTPAPFQATLGSGVFPHLHGVVDERSGPPREITLAERWQAQNDDALVTALGAGTQDGFSVGAGEPAPVPDDLAAFVERERLGADATADLLFVSGFDPGGLSALPAALDDAVGTGRWVVIVTSPGAPASGYRIDPDAVTEYVEDEVGAAVEAVTPAGIYLRDAGAAGEVADALGGYTLADHRPGLDLPWSGAGEVGARDRLFSAAVPGADLLKVSC